MLRKSASFIMLPLSVISGIAAFRSFKIWQEKYQHGETDEQYSARKEVEGLCDRVAAFPEAARRGKRILTPEEEAALNVCTKHCEAAKTSYQKMIEVMQARRQLQVGNQHEYGLLKIGAREDFYFDASDDYRYFSILKPTASEGVKKDIEQELKKGFRNL